MNLVIVKCHHRIKLRIVMMRLPQFVSYIVFCSYLVFVFLFLFFLLADECQLVAGCGVLWRPVARESWALKKDCSNPSCSNPKLGDL